MTRNFYRWLRFKTTEEIKETNPEIYRHYRKEQRKQLFNTFLNKKDWWLIPLYTALLMIIMAAIYLTPVKEIATTINQRISNLATVTSLSLAVIAFLMGNIATKEPYAYKVVFDTSKMHVIIFFILSFLGWSVLVATIAEPLSPCFWFPRFTVAIGYIFIVVIFLIGYMFNQVIRYTDQAKIDRFMQDELERHISVLIYESLIREKGLEIYQHMARKYGGITYDGSKVEEWDDLNTEMKFLDQAPKDNDDIPYLKDVDLLMLANNLARGKSNKVYFKNIQLDTPMDPASDFLRQDRETNTKEFNKEIRKVLYFGKKPIARRSMREHREHFDDKLVAYATEGKNKELKRILDSLAMLYKMKSQYRLYEDSDPTIELVPLLRKALNKSFLKKHPECIELLYTFFLSNASFAFANGHQRVMDDMMSFFPELYRLMAKYLQDSAFEDVSNSLINISSAYYIFFYSLSDLQKTDKTDFTLTNILGYTAYTSFSNLLYIMVRQRDYPRFKAAISMMEHKHGSYGDHAILEELNIEQIKIPGERDEIKVNKLRNSYENSRMLQNYRRHVVTGIRAWIFFLFDRDKLTSAEVRDFTIENRIPSVEMADTVRDILTFRKGNPHLNYMNWMLWSYQDDNEDKEMPNSIKWLTFGFMIEQVISNNLPMFSSDLSANDRDYLPLVIEDLTKIQKSIADSYNKWEELLGTKSKRDFKQKSNNVIAFFIRLNATVQADELLKLSTEPLDIDKVTAFRHSVEKKWKERANIYTLLSKYDKLKPKSATEGLDFTGRNDPLSKDKKLFTKDGSFDITLLGEVGAEAGRNLETEFFKKILLEGHDLLLSPDLIESIDRQLSGMEGQGIKPNAIFISSDLASPGQPLWKSEKFVANYDDISQKLSPNHFGSYNNVQLFRFQPDQLNGYIIIADLDSAFEMEYAEGDDKFENILEIDVHAIGEEEAEEIFEKRFTAEQFSSDEKSKKIQRIRTHVHISIGATVNFKVVNREAYRAIRLTETPVNGSVLQKI